MKDLINYSVPSLDTAISFMFKPNLCKSSLSYLIKSPNWSLKKVEGILLRSSPLLTDMDTTIMTVKQRNNRECSGLFNCCCRYIRYLEMIEIGQRFNYENELIQQIKKLEEIDLWVLGDRQVSNDNKEVTAIVEIYS
jgi:hypothetical protein